MAPSIFERVRNNLQKAETFFNEFCRPNTLHIKDQMELEFAYKRNKAFLLIEVFMILTFTFNLITQRGPAAYNIQGIVGTLIILGIFFLLCRCRPKAFKIFFNVTLLFYGPHLIYHEPEGVLGAWIAVQSHPTLVYLVTGSLMHYIFHTAVLTILLSTIYQSLIVKSLLFLSPSSYLNSLMYYSYQTTIYSLIFTVLTHKVIQSACTTIVEKRKEECERQKSFIMGFSHELRNIINSMTGNVKLANLEDLNQKAHEMLRNAEVCAELLMHLVNNILDTGKLQIGDLEIIPEPTNIYDAIEKLWCICSEIIKRKNLLGILKIKKNIPQTLKIDHYRLTQILLNLVGNAAKFTDSGKIEVSIEWIANTSSVETCCFEPFPFNEQNDEDEGVFEKSRALSVLDDDIMCMSFSKKQIDKDLLARRVSASKGILKIIVSDTGAGMEKEEVNKLFQKFTQVSSDISKRKLGTGLGLFITKELCQGMNGNIKAFSKKDKGSVFILCLPLEPVPEEEIIQFLNINILQGKNAIIIDDDNFSRLILENYLHKFCVKVSGASENGLIGYQTFLNRMNRGESTNIVTMDLDMPVMDGKTSAQKIRKLEAENGLHPCVLIIISGNCSESEIKECLDRNGTIKANAFLKKPVAIDELHRAILCSLLSPLYIDVNSP